MAIRSCAVSDCLADRVATTIAAIPLTAADIGYGGSDVGRLAASLIPSTASMRVGCCGFLANVLPVYEFVVVAIKRQFLTPKGRADIFTTRSSSFCAACQ